MKIAVVTDDELRPLNLPCTAKRGITNIQRAVLPHQLGARAIHYFGGIP